MTLAETRALLVSLLPPGADELYDLGTSTANVYKWFDGHAQALKTHSADVVDTLNTEIYPSHATAKLSDWERALGIVSDYAAQKGTTAGRRAAVVSKLRESGASSLPNIKAAAGKKLGYADPTQLSVIEMPRATLRTAHTYTSLVGMSVVGGGLASQTLTATDNNVTSDAGVQLRLNGLTYSNVEDVTVTLLGPDSFSVSWSGATYLRGPAAINDVMLYAPSFAGHTVAGTYLLTISSVAGDILITGWELFVEGIQRASFSGPEGLGRHVYEWAVLSDPALEGLDGPADFAGCRRALARIKPAHTLAFVARKMSGGGTCTICDDPNAVADACLVC